MDNVPVNTPSFADRHIANCNYASGACIETTLLTDLSEEERSRLAEHILTCSACARRFRQYQVIEEFAGELPLYNLCDHAKHPLWIAEAQ